MTTTHRNGFLLGLGMTLLAGILAATAFAAMSSDRIGPNLCETTGGSRYVDIPGFPGEAIDRRLLNDVKLLERRYKIFVTDGHSTDPVHSANGEHPIGLALDIVPNTAAGGTWRDISRLAKWAEPTQNQPIAPFRWVGYDGDSGHGRGHHLHLSWNHSETKPGVAPATVYTLRCPGAKVGGGGGGGKTDPQPEPIVPGGSGPGKPDVSGGAGAGSGSTGSSSGGSSTVGGGVNPGSGSSGGMSPRLDVDDGKVVAEASGVDAP